jgi:hypothetical protein
MIVRPKYLDFINIAVEIASSIPPYSSKFSKKTFTQQQLMAMYVLKQKSKLSYVEFVDDFSTRDSAILELGLSRVPSPTTIRMFAKRNEVSILEMLIGNCINHTRKRKLNTAVDATGFELEDGSYHYLKRLGKASKKRKSLKLNGCADTDKHLFLSAKIRKNIRHDNVDFKVVIKKAKKNTRKKIKTNTADKAYDSQENHEFAEKEGFEHITPLKNDEVPVWRTKGKHRKNLKRRFPKKKYNRRSIIENMFFCVKRLCGKVIYSKDWMMQRKEMLAKVLCYNINRLVQLRRICS